MLATETGKTLEGKPSRTWPNSPKNLQQPYHERLHRKLCWNQDIWHPSVPLIYQASDSINVWAGENSLPRFIFEEPMERLWNVSWYWCQSYRLVIAQIFFSLLLKMGQEWKLSTSSHLGSSSVIQEFPKIIDRASESTPASSSGTLGYNSSWMQFVLESLIDFKQLSVLVLTSSLSLASAPHLQAQGGTPFIF